MNNVDRQMSQGSSVIREMSARIHLPKSIEVFKFTLLNISLFFFGSLHVRILTMTESFRMVQLRFSRMY